MGKVIWYSISAALVGLLLWTAYTSLRGDFDTHSNEQRGFVRSF